MPVRLFQLSALALTTLVAACAPRVFSDATAIAVVGSAPAVPPPPERIELREKVQFARGSAQILDVSHSVLDDAVTEIKKDARIKRIRIEGHASSDGNDNHNLDLSQRRAEAVLNYFVSHGINGAMLEAQGLGESRPIADNETPEGRETNRRVELHVTEVGEGPDAAAP